MDAMVFIGEPLRFLEAIEKYANFHKTVVMDKKSKTDRQQLKTVFDDIIEVKSIYNNDEVDRAVAEILRERRIKAIYGSYESTIDIAGRLRSKFNIPGMTAEETLKVRNKALMKTVMQENGIPTADFTIINTLWDRLRLLAKLDKPMIIKPMDGVATIHTCKIDGFKDLFKVKTLIALFRHKTVLAESFIEGDEYHCDSVVADGKVIFSCVSKHLRTCLSALETGAPSGSICYPASFDSHEVIRNIKDLNERAIKALGIQNAVCIMEAFVDKDNNAVFSEIAARVGVSPMIPAIVKNTYGVDLHRAFVDLEMHNYIHHYDPKPVFTGRVQFPSRRGTVVEISKEADYADVQGLVKVEILNKTGDRLHMQTHTSVLTGYIAIEDTDCEQLSKKLYDAYNRFQLKVK